MRRTTIATALTALAASALLAGCATNEYAPSEASTLRVPDGSVFAVLLDDLAPPEDGAGSEEEERGQRGPGTLWRQSDHLRALEKRKKKS